jgi:hypothetical protein
MVFVSRGQQRGSMLTKNGLRPVCSIQLVHILPHRSVRVREQGIPHNFSLSNDDAGIIVLRSG